MPPSESEFARAVEALRTGEVVGLPTETVYGLAADGTNPSAVRRIFAIKGRPPGHPLILHLGDSSWLPRYTRDAPQAATTLAAAFWPGPLTLVLWRGDNVPDEVTAGLATVAVRVPSHPLALKVLRALGRPLAAPSANLFGKVSPTTREHVLQDLGSSVPIVLDGGPCQVGVESTILDLTGSAPRILRPGGVSEEEIEAALGRALAQNDGTRPRAPGTLEAHYAPQAKVLVVAPESLWEQVQVALGEGRRVGVFAAAEPPEQVAGQIQYRKMGLPHEAARDIYATLRSLDDARCEVIYATNPEASGIGSAVVDRLRRAQAGSAL